MQNLSTRCCLTNQILSGKNAGGAIWLAALYSTSCVRSFEEASAGWSMEQRCPIPSQRLEHSESDLTTHVSVCAARVKNCRTCPLTK